MHLPALSANKITRQILKALMKYSIVTKNTKLTCSICCSVMIVHSQYVETMQAYSRTIITIKGSMLTDIVYKHFKYMPI